MKNNNYSYFLATSLSLLNQELEVNKPFFVVIKAPIIDWVYWILDITNRHSNLKFNKNIVLYQTDCEEEYLKTIEDCKNKMYKTYYQKVNHIPDWLVMKEEDGRLLFCFNKK